jgi:hypothetical protein
MIISVPTEIRTRYLLNTNLERYRETIQAGGKVIPVGTSVTSLQNRSVMSSFTYSYRVATTGSWLPVSYRDVRGSVPEQFMW